MKAKHTFRNAYIVLVLFFKANICALTLGNYCAVELAFIPLMGSYPSTLRRIKRAQDEISLLWIHQF